MGLPESAPHIHIRDERNTMSYLCKHCGETDKENMMNRGGGKRSRNLCKSCHSFNTAKRGKANRLRWIIYKGGKCCLCGYSKYTGALEFHHIDSSKKDPKYQSFRFWDEEKVLGEIENCILLCSNCHREVHAGIQQFGDMAR